MQKPFTMIIMCFLQLALLLVLSPAVLGLDLPNGVSIDCQNTNFEEIMIKSINVHRDNHTVNHVTWNDTLAGWAQILTDRCVWQHNISIPDSSVGFYGQTNAGAFDGDPGYSVDLWYNDEFQHYQAYGELQPGDNDPPEATPPGAVFGHFTQVIWKGATDVGCAVTECGTVYAVDGSVQFQGNMVVCNWWPGESWYPDTQFKDNVLPPTGMDIVWSVCGVNHG